MTVIKIVMLTVNVFKSVVSTVSVNEFQVLINCILAEFRRNSYMLLKDNKQA